MARYVVLLRGINVGGKNLIGMPALKAFFEAQGFADVATYIQSGNVLITSGARNAALVTRIEAGLSSAFGYQASVVVRSAAQLRGVVEDRPAWFGAHPGQYRYDVVFLKEPLTAAEALEGLPTRPGVDRVAAGDGVLYFSRLTARASQSRLTRIVSLPIYRRLTIRNWNTTRRLAELALGDGA
jgi:uncharacterized protein (DUF1697 family)